VQDAQDLRLHGDVQGGRRLVGEDEVGVVRDRHRDHHTLPHAAGQFVRKRTGASERQYVDVGWTS
jgi:hypothetical protein